MRIIALPTRDGMIDDHFGHCDHYTIATIDDNNDIVRTERLDSPQGCGCKSNIAQTMQEMGITVMLAGNMGQGAFDKLSQHGITVIRGCHGKVDDILSDFINSKLTDNNETCDHHDCGNHGNSHTSFKLAL